MSDGSKISVNTQGAARGDITLDLNTLTLAGGADRQRTQAAGTGHGDDQRRAVRILAGAASGVFSTADSTGMPARSPSHPTLTLGDGAKMSVTTQAGAAGDIVATLGKTLSLTNGGQIQSNTTNTNPAVGGAGGSDDHATNL